MKETCKDIDAAIMNLAGLRVFLVVDEVLGGIFNHEPVRFLVHVSRHEGGQIQDWIPVQLEFVFDQLVRDCRRHFALRQLDPRNIFRSPATSKYGGGYERWLR